MISQFLVWLYTLSLGQVLWYHIVCLSVITITIEGLWSYGSWIYNYLCNQCLSPLMLWVRISIRARCTTLCDKVCQWLATDWWFFPGIPVSSTDKTDCYDITEILLKVVLNTIKQTQFTIWVKLADRNR
jgi:hypothetical protein